MEAHSLPRGVYWLPWTGRAGERFLVAINHRGERVMEATVFTGVDADPVVAKLWNVLDTENPVCPTLRVVA